MKVWAKRIESNLKRGVKLDLPGPRVVIVGDHGAGKSSVTQSLELALTGSVSDVLGRAVVAKATELLSLAPERQGPLFSRVVFSDGSEGTYSVNGSTAKAIGESLKAPSWLKAGVDTDSLFPLRVVRSALLGSADTTRKFFVGFTGEIKPEDIIMRLDDKRLIELYNTAKEHTLTSDSGTVKLLAALDYAAKKIRLSNQKAEAKTEAAHEIGRTIGVVPLPEEITAATTDVVNLRNRVRKETEKSQKAKELTRLLDAAVAKYTEASQKPISGSSSLSPQEAKLYRSVIPVLEQMIDMTISSGETVVLSPIDEETLTKDFLITRLENLCLALQTWEHANLLSLAEQDAIRYDAELASIGEVQLAEAQKALEVAEEKLMTLRSQQSQWTATSKVASMSIEDKLDAAKWTALRDALQRILDNQMKHGVSNFISKVQPYIGAKEEFFLRLVDGSREVCQYGFLRNGVLHTALSGGEWTKLTVALAAACQDKNLPWHGIIPEDRSWDPIGLANAMQTFTEVDAQFIITSCVAPKYVPQGWYVIEI